MKNRKQFYYSACLLALFVLWTAAVAMVDVRAIGPDDSTVGFAAVNRFIHNLSGVHMTLYTVTDWLSIVPVLFVMGFGLLGLSQWIHRKYLIKVDRSILALGGCYIVTGAAYCLFQKWIINYRPVLIDGILEPSYPSSTTMLVLCVMSTGAMQFRTRIRNPVLRKAVVSTVIAFTVFMVMGRLISGVHWFTDIVGGALLSAGLILLYAAISGTPDE